MPAADHDPPRLELRPMLERLLEQINELGFDDPRNAVRAVQLQTLAPIAGIVMLERIAVALERLAELERERLDVDHPHRITAGDPFGDAVLELLGRLRAGVKSHAYDTQVDRDVLELVRLVEGWRSV